MKAKRQYFGIGRKESPLENYDKHPLLHTYLPLHEYSIAGRAMKRAVMM